MNNLADSNDTTSSVTKVSRPTGFKYTTLADTSTCICFLAPCREIPRSVERLFIVKEDPLESRLALSG